MQKFQDQSIKELVEGDFRYARALDNYGVYFFNHIDDSLSEICRRKRISLEKLLHHHASLRESVLPSQATLNSYSVDIIINYLQHHHYLFIKEQLPFVKRLIDKLVDDNESKDELIADLKFIFPLFLEDFIHHIYEEEDSLFAYIKQLHQVISSGVHTGGLYYAMEKYSVQELAIEHVEDDDEMKGIRGIINQYPMDEIQDARIKVIFKELLKFDAELEAHARVENEILFPKALNLEKKVKAIYADKIRFN